ncbi:MAG: hypothetical protein HQL56_19330 [Magnetococcales bacterium]|nr:hypothetical protein [Magnetococcales bacterium]
MRQHLLGIAAGAALLLAGAQAGWADPWFGGTFSAEISLSNPGPSGGKATGKYFISDNKIRVEMNHPNEATIDIIDTKEKKAYSLMPASKQYFEGMISAPILPKPDVDILPDDAQGLCKQQSPQIKVQCTKSGTEDVGGIKADKWDVVVTHPKGESRAQILIDPGRKIVLGESNGDQGSIKRILKGTESVAGRPTEKWEFQQTHQGKTLTYTKWVDTALRLPVKVQSDKGVAYEITNIKEGPQAAELFTLPAGYQLATPPQPPMPPQGGAAPHGGAGAPPR